jgi:hypothetical protein
MVATKSDLDLISQRVETQPADYCKRLGLTEPISVSIKEPSLGDVFHRLAVAAMDPPRTLPVSDKSALKSAIRRRFVGVTVSVAVVSLCAYSYFRVFQRPGVKFMSAKI